MKFVLIYFIFLCEANSLLAQANPEARLDKAKPESTDPCQILRYKSDHIVDELEVHARFVTGYELKSLAAMLGISDEEIAASKLEADRELFLILRVNSTKKAHGSLYNVTLEIDNDSPIVPRAKSIFLPPLHSGKYYHIEKICEATDSRDGSNVFEHIAEKDQIDHVSLLHKQKPKFRLRSMITK